MNKIEIFELMKDIEYGWVDKLGSSHSDETKLFFDNYRLQSPSEIIKSKVGLCWDQVELERFYFANTELKIMTYFLCHYDKDMSPTHTFLVFKQADGFYWFEHSWAKHQGIHHYALLKELLIDIKNKFIESELKGGYDEDNLELYEYEQPNYDIGVAEFYSHCAKGRRIDLKNL